MELFGKLHVVIISIVIGLIVKVFWDISKPLSLPQFDVNQYWGPGDGKNYKEDRSIKPFKISYSQNTIQRLIDKINDTAQPTPPLEDTAFEYGFNSDRLIEILEYWKTSYLTKWNEREIFLNQFPQFKTHVQGLDIHFIHAKPKNVSPNTKVYPLLLLHGWPGSVREFYEIIPHLIKEKDNVVFEVIAPSLPGYGWSQGASKKNFGPLEISVVLRNLMLNIGFRQFYVQGGDWGSIIGKILTTLFPENVLGYHSNFCIINTPLSIVKTFFVGLYPSLFIDRADWMYPFNFDFLIQETGYYHIQATKPDTIGTALNDNPIGLAAYILEKFAGGTNPAYKKLKSGGFENDFSLDALLDNLMIYYLTNSITTAVRLYSEAMTKHQIAYKIDRVPIVVPSACARFRHEIMHQFDFIMKEKHTKLIQSTFHDEGGHFAALQKPQVLYEDILSFVQKTQKLTK